MSGYVKVITYENPMQFHAVQEIIPYLKYPHICATNSLKTGIKQRDIDLINNELVLSLSQIIESIYGDWSNTETKFSQYARLADVIRKRIEVSRDDKVLRAFQKNKLEVLNSMRLLQEINLNPAHFPNKTKHEEMLFFDIWKELETDLLNDLGDIRRIDMQKIFEEKEELEMLRGQDTLILHGFYFITPTQHYILNEWKKSGINLVFINLYVEDYPSTFSFLEKNFSAENGWIDKKDWIITKGFIPDRCRAFTEGFEGKIFNKNEIPENSFEYMFEFVEKIDDQEHYVAPSKKEIRERLKEYYPDSFKEKPHFLSYPIGQYILHLHTMWDEERKDYFLSESTLKECFASGWLQTGDRNAKDCVDKLKAILPYFQGCDCFDSWRKRMNHLIQKKKSINECFAGKQWKRSDYYKAVRINPILRFSQFSIPLKDLLEINEMLERLIADAKKLMSIENERSTIKEHLDKIQALLAESIAEKAFINPIEEKLVQQLEAMLSKTPSRRNEHYHISDLAEAIMIYLKGGYDQLGEQKTEDSQAGMTENNFNIFSIDELDGLVINPKVNSLHLCMMDEKSLPYDFGGLAWPLSENTIKSLNDPSMNMQLFMGSNSAAFSKYLFYYALTFEKNIRFSWVKNWRDQERLDKSIYIQLSNMPQQGNVDKRKYQILAISDVEKEERYVQGIKDRLNSLPKEEFAEMGLCKRRFFYSNVYSEFASYSSPFHQEFLMGNIVKVYGAQGMAKREVIKMIKLLFPNVSHIRQRTIVDQNLNENLVLGMKEYGLSRTSSYEKIEYPDSSTYFQYLTHRGAFHNEKWKSSFSLIQNKRKRSEFISQLATLTKVLPEAEPSEFCKLCPHAEYCEHAFYAADIEKKGFHDYEE